MKPSNTTSMTTSVINPNADALAVADGDRRVKQHRRDRRRSGHGQEQHSSQANGVLPELGDVFAA
jgi:hypothetical protein